MLPRPNLPRPELPLIQLVPNLLTLAAICAGLTALRLAFHGNFELAVSLIVLAAGLDGVDGRIARMLGSESDIGAELDSLADFLNFGVVPAMIVYLWALQDLRGIGWIAALIFAICCVMRLARFNVGMKSETQGPKEYFVGVPAPAGALLALLPLFAAFMAPSLPRLPDAAVSLYLVAVGALMISRLPTWSLKTSTIYAENARFVLVGVIAALAALITFPWETLVLADAAYLVGIVLAWRSKRKHVAKEDQGGHQGG